LNRAPRRLRAASCRAGFTLVEVLVAMLVLALVATLAWRGIDTMARSRDASRNAVDASQRLGTVLAQFERDLAELHDSGVLPALEFDGAKLRLTRRIDAATGTDAGGVQVVVWARYGDRWQRWASPVATQAGALQEHWFGSQQLQGQEPQSLLLLEGLSAVQVFFFRNNAWSNAQSAADLVAPPAASASAPPARAREVLPTGVRLLLTLPAGTITRDWFVAPQMP
jgi:general secretion pathway protein J